MSLIELSARGAADKNLNSDSSFTLFSNAQDKVTSFALETQLIDFSSGSVAFNSAATCTVSRFGDMMVDAHVRVVLPQLEDPTGMTLASVPTTAATGYPMWCNGIGYQLLQEVVLSIGGSVIDTLYSDTLFFLDELMRRPGAKVMEQIGRFEYSSDVDSLMYRFASKQRTLWVPLPFFFSTHKYFGESLGTALPLISMAFHDVTIKCTFRALTDLAFTAVIETDGTYGDYYAIPNVDTVPTNSGTAATLASGDLSASLAITYAYLDTAERSAFASGSYDYLIPIHQRQVHTISTANSTSETIRLYFNHPSNFMALAYRPSTYNTTATRRRFASGLKDPFDFGLINTDDNSVWGDVEDPITNLTLTVNGHNRIPAAIESTWSRLCHAGQFFPNVPSGYIYPISFAAKPGTLAPTSHINFSRIDNVALTLAMGSTLPAGEVVVVVESYNTLRIANGMASLVWSS